MYLSSADDNAVTIDPPAAHNLYWRNRLERIRPPASKTIS
jgi:hypothetical protein